MAASAHLDCLELGPPASQPAAASVIWLHGLGADGHDFAPIVPMLRMPSVRFVLPHAATRPVTINGGFVMRAWYDILALDFSGVRESERDIRASAIEIAALIERERQRGTPSDRIAIVGFSQGGAMAMHVGVRERETLAGIAVLSGYAVLGGKTLPEERSSTNAGTPTLFCHGRQDPVVPMFLGKAAHDQLKALDPGRPLEWHDYPMGHEVCPEELAVIAKWLRACLRLDG
ncbi:alpha/beta hydrolase [Nannocystaceae bacterium ST9]